MNLKKKIAIIGANEFQNPLILKAKELGYETHVFSWGFDDIGQKTADYFYSIDIKKMDEILNVCKKIGVSGVCTIASDLANITVNYVSNKLGLTSNSNHCLSVSTNKYLMREAFKEKNIPSTGYFLCKGNYSLDSVDLNYPLIVKPTDRSGSRSITKVDNKNDLELAVQEAIDSSFEKKAIIEEYIEGSEYSVECISFEGVHTLLAITKKYTTGAPKFIEVGHMQPSGLSSELADKAKEIVLKALDGLEIKYGASHSEFKIDEKGNIKIIEIGSRMGGDCIGSDLVEISTGYDFLKMVIDVSCGNKPDFKKSDEANNCAIKFILNENDLNKLKFLQENYSKNIYKISDIEPFTHEVSDSSSRFGYYILQWNKDEGFIDVFNTVI